MLESYEHEIIRKRRAARFFWILVFSFATFLYFFFQGYYPAFDITWKQVFSSGGVRELSRDELIRSFGIINVRAYPRNAVININGQPFGFDEKKMVPYGKYRLSVGTPGYIQKRVRFEINKKTPYYISEIHLMPQAQYKKIGTGSMQVFSLEKGKWLSRAGKTHLLFDEYFLTGSRMPSPGTPLGEGYFLSGTSISHFENGEFVKKIWSGSTDFIKSCGDGVSLKENALWCQKNKNALSREGKLFTGIRDIYPEYLLGEDMLFVGKEQFSLNPQERLETEFILLDSTWYTPRAGLLVPIAANSKKESVPLIDTSLDTIGAIRKVEGSILVFGRKGNDTFLVFQSENEKFRIPFPDIPLKGIEVTKTNGIYFFKASTALLFLYEGSEKIEWITEGQILSYSQKAALYKKSDEIWRVSWEEIER